MKLGRARALIAIALLASALQSAQAQHSGSSPPVKREIIPGSELITSRDRARYRQRVRAAKSADEEARVRKQHVIQMRERARLRGLQLPDAPKAETPQ